MPLKTIGLLLAMGSLIALHRNQIVIGLPAFVIGMYLMMKKTKK